MKTRATINARDERKVVTPEEMNRGDIGIISKGPYQGQAVLMSTRQDSLEFLGNGGKRFSSPWDTMEVELLLLPGESVTITVEE